MRERESTRTETETAGSGLLMRTCISNHLARNTGLEAEAEACPSPNLQGRLVYKELTGCQLPSGLPTLKMESWAFSLNKKNLQDRIDVLQS